MPRSVTVKREIGASINGFCVDGRDVIVTELEFELGGLRFKLERTESNVISLTAHRGTVLALEKSVCWTTITEKAPSRVQVRLIDEDQSTPSTWEFQDGKPLEAERGEQHAPMAQ